MLQLAACCRCHLSAPASQRHRYAKGTQSVRTTPRDCVWYVDRSDHASATVCDIIQVFGPCLLLVSRTLERPGLPISRGHLTPLCSKYLSFSFATYLNDFSLARLISITHHQLLRTTSGLHDSHGRNHDRRIAAICQCQCLSAPLLSNAYRTNFSSFSRSVALTVCSFVFCTAKRNSNSSQHTSSIQFRLQTYEMLLPNRQTDQIATVDIRKHSLDCYGSGYWSYHVD